MPDITIRDMFAAGVHLGHNTSFWNPKMAEYIYSKHNKIHIIDLDKTLPMFKRATAFVKQLAKEKKTILFVGTKRSAQESIAKHAQRCGMPYIDQRWLGGTFTNFKVIRLSIQRYHQLLEEYEKTNFSSLSKKDRLKRVKEFDKLRKVLHGIKDTRRVPDAIFAIDVRYENIAIREAAKIGVPIVAVVDSNNSMETITYPIPGNDDSIKAINFYAQMIADAVLEGVAEQSDEVEVTSDTATVAEDEAASAETTGSGDTLKVITKKSGKVIKETAVDMPPPKPTRSRGRKQERDQAKAEADDKAAAPEDAKDTTLETNNKASTDSNTKAAATSEDTKTDTSETNNEASADSNTQAAVTLEDTKTDTSEASSEASTDSNTKAAATPEDTKTDTSEASNKTSADNDAKDSTTQ